LKLTQKYKQIIKDEEKKWNDTHLELNKEAYENQIKILTPLFETPDMTPKQKKEFCFKNTI